MRLYDVTTLQFDRELSCLHEKGINDIDWDGKQGSTLLCTASDDKTIGLWDTRTGEVDIVHSNSCYLTFF